MTTADPRCNGICLTAAEIGVPGQPGVIAYAHPDCEAHGAAETGALSAPDGEHR